MKNICKSVSTLKDISSIERIEDKYNINFPKDMIRFFEINNGGIPNKKEFAINGKEYELRCFLSFNQDEYNSIHKAIDSFQIETKGKIAPFAKDSADNYYCINLETGIVYYCSGEENLYFKLTENFNSFLLLLQ